MRWRTHPHMPATVAAKGARGDYWITTDPRLGYQTLYARGHDGLTVMAHTPTGTAEIPYEGKVCRDLKEAKALAEAMDKEREAGVGGT